MVLEFRRVRALAARRRDPRNPCRLQVRGDRQVHSLYDPSPPPARPPRRVPRADRRKAAGVPVVMSTVRVRMRRWGTRTRGRSLAARPPLVARSPWRASSRCSVRSSGSDASRATSAAARQAYGPQKLPAVSVSAGIPYGLAAAPPIPSLAVAEAPQPARSGELLSRRGTARLRARRSEASADSAQRIRASGIGGTNKAGAGARAVRARPGRSISRGAGSSSSARAWPSSSEGGSFDSSG